VGAAAAAARYFSRRSSSGSRRPDPATRSICRSGTTFAHHGRLALRGTRPFHDHIDVSGVRRTIQPRSRLRRHGISCGRAVPGSRPLPHTPAPAFRAVGRVPLLLPVGGVAELAPLPNIGAGWAAVPGAGPGPFRTSPPLPRARAPRGGPDPPPRGDHRAGSRCVHHHDRRDRDMGCRGAVHVPGALIMAVVGGFGNGTTASCVGTRPRRARPGPAWARVGNGRPNDHDFRGSYPTRPPSARKSGSAPDPLRVRPKHRWGRKSRAGNGAPTATRPTRQGHGGAGRGVRIPCPVTPPSSRHAPRRRLASA
jgi:hypothetical protein